MSTKRLALEERARFGRNQERLGGGVPEGPGIYSGTGLYGRERRVGGSEVGGDLMTRAAGCEQAWRVRAGRAEQRSAERRANRVRVSESQSTFGIWLGCAWMNRVTGAAADRAGLEGWSGEAVGRSSSGGNDRGPASMQTRHLVRATGLARQA